MTTNDTNFEETNVIESHPAGPPQAQVVDAFAISIEFRNSLLEYFSDKKLNDSEIEKVYNFYQGLKNAAEIKVTISQNGI